MKLFPLLIFALLLIPIAIAINLPWQENYYQAPSYEVRDSEYEVPYEILNFSYYFNYVNITLPYEINASMNYTVEVINSTRVVIDVGFTKNNSYTYNKSSDPSLLIKGNEFNISIDILNETKNIDAGLIQENVSEWQDGKKVKGYKLKKDVLKTLWPIYKDSVFHWEGIINLTGIQSFLLKWGTNSTIKNITEANTLQNNTVSDVIIYDITKDTVDYATWYNDSTKSWWKEANQTKIDSALVTDGSGDWAQITNQASIQLTGDFTIVTWFKMYQNTQNHGIFSKGSETVGEEYAMYWFAGGTQVYIILKTSSGRVGGQCGSAAPLQEDWWYHLTFLHNESADTITCYVNASSIGTRAVAGVKSTNTENLTIGSSKVHHSNASIDELYIYNRALTAYEITTSYERGLIGLKNNLTATVLGSWDFDTGVVDGSGNNAAGFLVGNAKISGRSSKVEFPKKSTIITTHTGLEIVDLDNITNPKLWMRSSEGTNFALPVSTFNTANALNGKVYVGGTSGLYTFDFINDYINVTNSSGTSAYNGLIINRTEGNGWANPAGADLINSTVNDICVRRINGADMVLACTNEGVTWFNQTQRVDYSHMTSLCKACAFLNDSYFVYSNTTHLMSKTDIPNANWTADNQTALSKIQSLAAGLTNVFVGLGDLGVWIYDVTTFALRTGTFKYNTTNVIMGNSSNVTSLALVNDSVTLYIGTYEKSQGGGVSKVDTSTNVCLYNWTVQNTNVSDALINYTSTSLGYWRNDTIAHWVVGTDYGASLIEEDVISNTAPTYDGAQTAITDINMSEDSYNNTGNVSKIFTDAEGDALTAFEFNINDSTHFTVSINNATGVINVSSKVGNWSGDGLINITAFDGKEWSVNSTQFDIGVGAVNDRPYFNHSQTEAFNFTLSPVYYNDSVNLSRIFADVDSLDLNFSYFINDSVHFNVSINNLTDKVNITGWFDWYGSAWINFSVWDGLLNSYNYSVNFNVSVNDTTAPRVVYGFQDPPDVSQQNIFNRELNVSYNVTDNFLNVSRVSFNYKVNSTALGEVFYYQNGTLRSGWVRSLNGNRTNISNVWSFYFMDNEIYPGVYTYGVVSMANTIHETLNLTTNLQYVSTKFYNVSNLTFYNMLEVYAENMTANTQTLRVYYCNSSYVSGNPPGNVNCVNFYNIPAGTPFNHTHPLYSKHLTIPMPINVSDGTVANLIKVSNESQILFRGRQPGGWSIYYITNLTRPDTTRYSSNNGLAWSNFSGSVDTHLHQYDNETSIWYYVCANDTSGNENCSSVRQDLMQLGGIPPSAPNLFSPVASVLYRDLILINYSASLSPNLVPMKFYNISLVYDNESFVSTIKTNNSLNLSYLWNSSNAEAGDYVVRVEVCDNYSYCSYGYSENFSINHLPYFNDSGYIPNHGRNHTIWDVVSLWANVTETDDEVLEWVSFKMLSPNGSVAIDENGTQLGNVWNSSLYNLSDGGKWNVSLSASDGFGVGNWSFWFDVVNYSMYIYEWNVTDLGLGSSVNWSASVITDSDLRWCNFTLDYPNGSNYFNNSVGNLVAYSPYLEFWNHSLILSQNGTYRGNITCETNMSVKDIYRDVQFFVSDYWLLSPSSYVDSIQSDNLEILFNISFRPSSAINFSYDFNVTSNYDSQNFTLRLNNVVNFTQLNLTNSTIWKIPVNLSINNLTNGTYDFNITLFRINASYHRNETISIVISKNPPSGNVVLLNESVGYQCSGTYCDKYGSISGSEAIEYSWFLNNTGSSNLTNCTVGFDNSLNGLGSSSLNDFNITTGQVRNLSYSWSINTTGTYEGFLNVTCVADDFGSKDSLITSQRPYVKITRLSAGGSTSGGGGSGGYIAQNMSVMSVSEIQKIALNYTVKNGKCEDKLGESFFISDDCKFNIRTLFCTSKKNEGCLWKQDLWWFAILGIGVSGILITMIFRKKEENEK